MLLGITTKLPGWRLAITGAKLTWNHSWKSSGSKSSNSGARAVKVTFKMVSRTTGFGMKVLFLWKKRRGFMFQFRSTLYLSEIIVEMRTSSVTHLCSALHLGHDSRHRRQQFVQQDDQKCAIFSQSLGPYWLLQNSLEPRTSFTRPVCQPTFRENMAILKVKQSPACWCLQWPGKTDWAAHHHGTLSSLSTPPWWPHPPNLDPGSAQPSGLVRGSPKLPTDDTNKEDIWNAFLFDMAKPPLCADFPSSEYGAAVFNDGWWWNVWLTPEMLKTLRAEYVVYRENGPKFASSHSASLWIPCLQTKACRWTLVYVPFSKDYFSLIHTEQVKCQFFHNFKPVGKPTLATTWHGLLCQPYPARWWRWQIFSGSPAEHLWFLAV